MGDLVLILTFVSFSFSFSLILCSIFILLSVLILTYILILGYSFRFLILNLIFIGRLFLVILFILAIRGVNLGSNYSNFNTLLILVLSFGYLTNISFDFNITSNENFSFVYFGRLVLLLIFLRFLVPLF